MNQPLDEHRATASGPAADADRPSAVENSMVEGPGPAESFDGLEELAASLERDGPAERTSAVEGLATVEPALRLRIIAGLGRLPRGPGLTEFLQTLCRSPDTATAEAARQAAERGDRFDRSLVKARFRLVGSLVSAVDGRGRGTIAVAVESDGIRRSAVFRCDVLAGIEQASDRVEAASAKAGSLVDETAEILPADLDRLQNVPGLALSMLAGILHVGARSTASAEARAWIDKVFGAEFTAQPILISMPNPYPHSNPSPKPMPIRASSRTAVPIGGPWETRPAGAAAMEARARTVLDACPSWFDLSSLTLEIAREIELREGGRRPTDPVRHAGAYRYLFEHHLSGRLSMYGRMLLWMASFWRTSGADRRADAALAVAAELADEQYAVPAHPFTERLTTESLDQARRLVRDCRV